MIDSGRRICRSHQRFLAQWEEIHQKIKAHGRNQAELFVDPKPSGDDGNSFKATATIGQLRVGIFFLPRRWANGKS